MLKLSIIISIIAFTYSVILTDSGMILFKFKALLYNIIGKYPLIFKPIIDCAYCVSGQMAFWFYFYLVFFKGIEYYWFDHLTLICISIFNIAIIKRLGIYEK